MIKFSFEVPIKHLDDFDEYQDFVFALSMLVHNQKYKDYLLKKQHQGLTTLWIDNSFNETFEADGAVYLASIFHFYSAQRVVAPDSIYWDTKQIVTAYKQMRQRLWPKEIIVAPQTFEIYKALREEGALHFAVSYWVRNKWTLEELQQIPNLHFLGCLGNKELIDVRPASCDTGMPIKLAMQDTSVMDWIWKGCPHIHNKDLGLHGRDYFQAVLTPEQLALAKANILELKRLTR